MCEMFFLRFQVCDDEMSKMIISHDRNKLHRTNKIEDRGRYTKCLLRFYACDSEKSGIIISHIRNQLNRPGFRSSKIREVT